MKLLKLFIPKQKAQVVTEIESWSVTWFFKTGWSDNVTGKTKAFLEENDAKKFKEQLEESAKFIGCWIEVHMVKN
jgi:hypothetical protein